ncbi:hypothetical protein HK101_007993 [Irineochytrium annulatum]|nr:hypothetical protein HK101_007993 [Irineochytrium annulatum]
MAIEERHFHTTRLLYSMNFDIMSAVAGYLLTLRAPLDSLFYTSASESLAITFVQRLVICLHFRWKRRRQVKAIDVEVDVIKAEKVDETLGKDICDNRKAPEPASAPSAIRITEINTTPLIISNDPATHEPSEAFTPKDPATTR